MTIVVADHKNPGCLVQLLWFVLIGWWLGQIWIGIAWLLMVTIVGIPFGVIMLNGLPQVIALRSGTGLAVRTVGGSTTVTSLPQYPLVLRAIYFILIGWWLAGIWIELAYLACVTIIGLPLGFWMFDRVPAIVSLRR